MRQGGWRSSKTENAKARLQNDNSPVTGAAELDAEAVRPRLKAAFATYEITSEFECIERLVAGDLAVDRGWDVQQLRPRSGGEEMVNRQRVMLVLRRSSDGKWRFARGMSQPGPPA